MSANEIEPTAELASRVIHNLYIDRSERQYIATLIHREIDRPSDRAEHQEFPPIIEPVYRYADAGEFGAKAEGGKAAILGLYEETHRCMKARLAGLAD